MKKRKTKFNTTLGVPVAQGFLCNGSPFNAIIDTGSEETLIDKDCIKENKKCFTLERTDYKINFMGIHGEKDTRIIHASADIFFKFSNGKRFCVFLNKGMVYDMILMKEQIASKTDLKIHAIIGSKFLNNAGAEINFNTKELIFSLCQTETKM